MNLWNIDGIGFHLRPVSLDPLDVPNDLNGWEILEEIPFGSPARAFALSSLSGPELRAEIGVTMADTVSVPKTMKQAQRSVNAEGWTKAVRKELDQLTKTETWRIVNQSEQPDNLKPITGTIVFAVKGRSF